MIDNINLELINLTIPETQKLKGLLKLGNIVSNNNSTINSVLLPQTQLIAKELGIENLGKSYQTIPESCIEPQKLSHLLKHRNNIAQKLNNINNRLSSILTTIDKVKSTNEDVKKTINALKLTKTTLSQTSKVLPIVPPIVPSTLSDLEDLKNAFIFTPTGNPKLEKNISTVESLNTHLVLIQDSIKRLIQTIGIVDVVFTKCSTEPLTPIDNSLISLINIDTTQKTYYQEFEGFIIDIQTIPFGPTLSRIRAIAKNKQGTILLTTELSFTQNQQTLIDELKLNILKNNLKP